MGPLASGLLPRGPSLNRVQAVDGGAGQKRGFSDDTAKVLLSEYNGANNTGVAEALLQADIQDFRVVFGGDAVLTVPAIKDAANLRRYLREAHAADRFRPSVFFGAVRASSVSTTSIVLVEGSAYMDTWTSALLWYFLWATRCAAQQGEPCLAYAVDAGQLRPRNQRLVRRYASSTNLVVTRSEAAADACAAGV